MTRKPMVFLGSLLLFLLSGCTSLTTPVLRHEIGETLGSNHYRIRAQLETSRLFPLVPVVLGATGMEQDTAIFRGGLFGLQGTAGIYPKLDLQLGTFYSLGGGGWRLGGKYQLFFRNNFAVAAMTGIGRYAAQGTETYATPTGSQSVTQTLSSFNYDLSFPVSFRMSKMFVVYSGLNTSINSVTGSAMDTYVADKFFDIGVNLGLKVLVDRFEGDFEFALINVGDPINPGRSFIPYFGISGGILF